MAFYLFILLNVVLFLRPGELIPALEGVAFFEFTIITCIVISVRSVFSQLSLASLGAQPITACLVGLMAAVVLSHLSNGNTFSARIAGFEYLKIFLYFLVAVSAIDSLQKLDRFLSWLCVLILIMASMALLEYHGVVDLPPMAPVAQGDIDRESGEQSTSYRLCGPGIFHDPNDLSVVLIWGILICLCRLEEGGGARIAWTVTLGVLVYSLTLTQSRGGLLALLVCVFALVLARFQGRRSFLLATFSVPVILALFGGRQTNLNVGDSGDTSQERIQIWSRGLELVKASPIFGSGMDTFAEHAGLVAHNSFVEAFAELGLFGGCLFLTAFGYAVTTTWRIARQRKRLLPTNQWRLGPYLLAMTTSTVVSMLSLSRLYTIAPYIVLALTTSYFRSLPMSATDKAMTVTPRLILWGLIGGLAFLFLAYGMVVGFARW